jgi:hypothetical protein
MDPQVDGRPTVDTRTFDAHGVTFTISSPDADVVAVFDDLLVDFGSDNADGASPNPPSIRYAVEATLPDRADPTWYRVTAGDEVVYTSLLEGSLVSHLLMDVNARAAAACRDDATIPLHAGTVAGALGAIVLPGASHSGKTTITTALAAAGHRFVADEVSRLDPDRLTIAPYGKPVALRAASVDLLAPSIARLRRPGSRFEIDERFVPPSELATSTTGGVASQPVEVSAIVFPRYDANGPHRFAPLGSAETLERLMQCTLGIASTPVGADVFRILERLVRAVPGHELVYTELHAALDDLVPLMTDDPTPSRATSSTG